MQTFKTWTDATAWVEECSCDGRRQIGEKMLFSHADLLIVTARTTKSKANKKVLMPLEEPPR